MKPEKTHLDNTGELANRHVSSIARVPGRATAVGPVLKGGLSPDHCPGHSADRPWGSPQPPASALTVSKCQAWEMSNAGCSGHRPHKRPHSPGDSVWSTSSRCLSPRDYPPPRPLLLIPVFLQTHHAPHTADTSYPVISLITSTDTDMSC